MKTLKIVPDGWTCRLIECPPGFFVHDGQLCFKTEYNDCECYNSAGEVFHLTESKNEVQPVVTEWVDEE